MPLPSHPLWFDHPNTTLSVAQIMKPLIMQSPVTSSILGPNIFLSTLLSHTFNTHSSSAPYFHTPSTHILPQHPTFTDLQHTFFLSTLFSHTFNAHSSSAPYFHTSSTHILPSKIPAIRIWNRGPKHWSYCNQRPCPSSGPTILFLLFKMLFIIGLRLSLLYLESKTQVCLDR
jgi:hypothetical protein